MKNNKLHTQTMLTGLLLTIASMTTSAEPTTDWTGAYAGFNLGALWSGSTVSAQDINLLSSTGTYRYQSNSTAVNPGIQFGYLHALDEHFVVGGEADFTYPSTSNTVTQWNPTGSAYDQFKTKYNVQGSLRLRLGYAFDRWLPFVTTGVSFGGMGASYQSESGNYAATTTAQTGWVLGGGVEYAVLDNLSTRLEYLYTDYGNAMGATISQVEQVSYPLGSMKATMNTNVLRAALNFRF